MKKTLSLMLAAALALTSFSAPAYADDEAGDAAEEQTAEFTDAAGGTDEDDPAEDDTGDIAEDTPGEGTILPEIVQGPAAPFDAPESDGDDLTEWEPNFTFDEKTGELSWDNIPYDIDTLEKPKYGSAYAFSYAVYHGTTYLEHIYVPYSSLKEGDSFRPSVNLAAYFARQSAVLSAGEYTISLKAGFGYQTNAFKSSKTYTYNFKGGKVLDTIKKPVIKSYVFNKSGEYVNIVFDKPAANVIGYLVKAYTGYSYNTDFVSNNLYSKYYYSDIENYTASVCAVDADGNTSEWTELGKPEEYCGQWKANFKYDEKTGVLSWDKAPLDFTGDDKFNDDTGTAYYTVEFGDGEYATDTYVMNYADPSLDLISNVANRYADKEIPEKFNIKVYAGKGYHGYGMMMSSDTYEFSYKGGKVLDSITKPVLKDVVFYKDVNCGFAKISNYDDTALWYQYKMTGGLSNEGVQSGSAVLGFSGYWSDVDYDKPTTVSVRVIDKDGNYSQWAEYNVTYRDPVTWNSNAKLNAATGVLTWNEFKFPFDGYTFDPFVYNISCNDQNYIGKYAGKDYKSNNSWELLLDLAGRSAYSDSYYLYGKNDVTVDVGADYSGKMYKDSGKLTLDFKGGFLNPELAAPSIKSAVSTIKVGKNSTTGELKITLASADSNAIGYVVRRLTDYYRTSTEVRADGTTVITSYETPGVLTRDLMIYAIDKDYNYSKPSAIFSDIEYKTVKDDVKVKSIAIGTAPKTEYLIGEELDLTGGTLLVTFDDGTTENVAMTAAGVEVTGFDSSKTGKCKVTFKYEGKTATLEMAISIDPDNAPFTLNGKAYEDFDTLMKDAAAFAKKNTLLADNEIKVNGVLTAKKAITFPKGSFKFTLTGSKLTLAAPTVTANCDVVLDCELAAEKSGKTVAIKAAAGKTVTIAKEGTFGTISGAKGSKLIMTASITAETIKTFDSVDSGANMITVTKGMSAAAVGTMFLSYPLTIAKKIAIPGISGVLTVNVTGDIKNGSPIFTYSGKDPFDRTKVEIINTIDSKDLEAFLYKKEVRAEIPDLFLLNGSNCPSWEYAVSQMTDAETNYSVEFTQDMEIAKFTLPTKAKSLTINGGGYKLDLVKTKSITSRCALTLENITLTAGGTPVAVKTGKFDLTVCDASTGALTTTGKLTVNGTVTADGAVSAAELASTETGSHITLQSLAVTKSGITEGSAPLTLKFINKQGKVVTFEANDKKDVVVVKTMKFPRDKSYAKGSLLLDTECGDFELEFKSNKLILGKKDTGGDTPEQEPTLSVLSWYKCEDQ